MTKYLALAMTVVLAGIDQGIKIWAAGALAPNGRIEVIPGLFFLSYVENRGAAFGILQGRAGLLSILVILVLIVALYMLLTEKIHEPFLVWSVALVIAGGAGNLIDRMAYGYVIDYLDFSPLFNFPVFNFADCCVVIGTILILIHILFLDRSDQEKAAAPLTENTDTEEAQP